jgi:NDP-sugar pyrophosphorylase family protein
VKGFVLAAGLGTRLRPITEVVPKPLLPVGNLPMIGYALRLLAHHGITDVIVNVHHLSKTLMEAVGDGSQFGVEITYSEEEEILGTGGGIRKMRDQLEDGPFVVVNGDTLIDVDLAALIEAHTTKGAIATLALRRDARQEEFGQLEMDPSGRIRKILGHGEPSDQLESYMFTGVHIVDPRLLDYLPPDVESCIMRYGYTKALANDELLCGVPVSGYWNDAGTPERYVEANVDALSQRMEMRHADPLGGFALAPKRAVAEVVRMGEDVDLGTGAEIRPPVLLGEESRIGEQAVVGPFCVVQPRVQIGRDANLSHCIVLEGARIEAGTVAHNQLISKKAAMPLGPQPADEPPAS